MTDYEKMELVKKLLGEIMDTWNDENIKEYGSILSMDELNAEIQSITLEIN